jgi:L,D-transpeptidase ErfK/SrfK
MCFSNRKLFSFYLIFFGLIPVCLTAISKAAEASYAKPYVGDQQIYIAHKDDTLVHIARRFGLGFVELRAANPQVDPWIPGEGTKLNLPSRHLLPDAPRNGIVINLPEMRMYAFLNGSAAPATFPLGVGREGLETPMGSTTVVRKQEGPIWRPTPRMRREDPTLPEVVYQGPDNPMGTHAMYLGWPSYAIHGTNKPYGIGRRSSSGCLRLYPENIIDLFEMTPVGTRVTVVNQPIKLAWIDGVLYMEAHPELEQAFQMEETGQVFASKMSEQDMETIVKAAGEHRDRLHWATIRNEVRNRSGMPVMIARMPDAVVPDENFEVIDGRKLDPPEKVTDVDQIEEPMFSAVVEAVQAPEETIPATDDVVSDGVSGEVRELESDEQSSNASQSTPQPRSTRAANP